MSQRRAAVVSWDLGHNPVGRAWVLVELLRKLGWTVDLVGPQFARFGNEVWSPIRDLGGFQVRRFWAKGVVDYLPQAVALTAGAKYDLVVTSKFRLPGLHLGLMLADWSQCPLLVDIDDDETAFADKPGGPPPSEMLTSDATAFAESLLADLDLTIAGSGFRDRFAGTVVRHARKPGPPVDSAAFAALRAQGRAWLGITSPAAEFTVLFNGTVRPHKGLKPLLQAVESLAPQLPVRLHIVTNTPLAEVQRIIPEDLWRYATYHGPCRMDELTQLNAAADLVVLPQDLTAAASAYQVPAKISDAAAVGCRVLVSDTPAIADLAAAGVVTTFSDTRSLPNAIAAQLTQAGLSGPSAEVQLAFESELGYDVNAARMDRAIERASAHQGNGGVALAAEAANARVFALFRERSVFGVRPTARPSSAPTDTRQGYDIALFWKQHDVGVYGRRVDMMWKYLDQSDRVRKTVMFDAPTDVGIFERTARWPRTSQATRQADLLLESLTSLLEPDLETPSVDRSKFIFTNAIRRGGWPGFPLGLPGEASYAEFVEERLAAAGLDPKHTIALVYPVAPKVIEILDHIGFGGIICDIVDDERLFPSHSPRHRRSLDQQYRQVLAMADLAVSNSPTNVEAFARHVSSPIHLIPNAAEPLTIDADKRPDGPHICYVGNMRDRFDWDLLFGLAERRPNWQFHLAGELPAAISEDTLSAKPNVHFHGVVPYPASRELLASMDVAATFHTQDPLAKSMDPLKLYNYLAAGLPVVATPHTTAKQLPGVTVASNVEEFETAIQAAVAAPDRTLIGADVPDWRAQAESLLDLMDATFPMSMRVRQPRRAGT